MNPNITVLIADDEPGLLKIMEHNLRKIGFKNIIATKNGKVALEALTNNKIDLILSDWNMPEMNGVELFNTLKKKEGLKGTPFIFVTSNAEGENVKKAMKEGIKNYMIKPYELDTLELKIKEALK